MTPRATADSLLGVQRGRDHSVVGARIPRREDRRLLTGAGRYVGDITVPRMCHAAFVRSSQAHALISAIDVADARVADGVVAVLTAADLAPVTFVDYATAPTLKKTPQPVLASDRVRFVGEPVAIVIAETRALAEDAAELVDVTYEPLTAHVDVDSAAVSEQDLLFPELGSNVVFHEHVQNGDPDAAFAEAAHVVKGRYHGNRYVASPMEGAGIVASYDPGSEELQVWAGTQSPHVMRNRLVDATGLPAHRVRVQAPDVGGAFGQKIPIRVEEAAVCLAAIRLGRPVRWLEDRYENLVAAPHGKEQVIDVELAMAADGTFLGLRCRIVGDAGAYSHNSASALIEPLWSSRLMPGPYRIANYEYEMSAVVTNKSPVAPYRGVGMTAGHTARELVVERAASLIGRDPADLRMQNLVPADAFPYTSCTGMVYDSGSYQECLRTVLERVGYEDFRKEQQAARAEGRYLGIAVSPYVEPGGFGTEGARQAGSSSFPSHDSARVSMDHTGKVLIAAGTPSQGQGHATALCQVVAEQLSVDIEDVSLLPVDTATSPVSMAGTRASRVAVVTGGALTLAASDVKDTILALAGAMLEVDPGDLRLEDGRVSVVGAPEHSLTVRDVAHAAHFNPELRSTVAEPQLTSTRFYDPKASYSNGCIAVTVEVDPETGQVRLRDVVAAEDCGTVINPMIVDGQVHGAVVQGIGGALFEHLLYGSDGQVLTSTFMDYLLPTAPEIPDIGVVHIESPSPNSIGGAKGMAESGAVATPAAVANAVVDALSPFGVVVESLPLSPQAVVRLLEAADREDPR
ncbi:xanthine dehydrogenase family protein molybdopterin-binding subunit [Blastococcus sp. CT_GayMR20]|uniref:xanthine dehydrogenase family protein molybdopterin-binding subunit n=1 Tax=Blastococcus sp. CT_GayMR20 TaxID=2559609 RepID=UPI001073ED90|nr:xanthine dehydrogenase family protein molybdopterin-binding subunit [Blastococcus sp. CT_GayMR20]TFV67950.1 xanthine dehydrogenase family protein molybdopterin-binding subunit [Blastococcus sp. CT_GayMR20]